MIEQLTSEEEIFFEENEKYWAKYPTIDKEMTQEEAEKIVARMLKGENLMALLGMGNMVEYD